MQNVISENTKPLFITFFNMAVSVTKNSSNIKMLDLGQKTHYKVVQVSTGQHRYHRCMFLLFSPEVFRVSGYYFFHRAKRKKSPLVTAELDTVIVLHIITGRGWSSMEKQHIGHFILQWATVRRIPPPPGHCWSAVLQRGSSSLPRPVSSELADFSRAAAAGQYIQLAAQLPELLLFFFNKE